MRVSQFRGGGSHSEQGGGAIQIVKTHLYGEKLHSYGRTVKLGGGLQPPSPPFPPPMCPISDTCSPAHISLGMRVSWIVMPQHSSGYLTR